MREPRSGTNVQYLDKSILLHSTDKTVYDYYCTVHSTKNEFQIAPTKTRNRRHPNKELLVTCYAYNMKNNIFLGI